MIKTPPNHVRSGLGTSQPDHPMTKTFDASYAPQMLAQLIVESGHDPAIISVEDLQEIASRLSEFARKDPAWGWRYLRNVLNRKIDASRALINAIVALGATNDGTPEELARARSVTVMVIGDVKPGALVLADSRACAFPGCGIHFVPRSPQQRYHAPRCQKADYKRRKENDRIVPKGNGG